MSVSNAFVFHFEAYVVLINVPLLLGLGTLQKIKLLVNFENSTLLRPCKNWRVDLANKMGHMYDEWPPTIYYTETELQKIHRYFYHPSTDRFVNLI